MSQKIKVYLVAGEPSGDLLASRLMRVMKKDTNVSFFGVGGEAMAQQGLKSLFNISDLSVMGFFEVLPSIPRILKRLHQVVNDIQKIKPDIVVTVDSWSFSIQVHKLIQKKKISVPHVHYVAPQVWAWKSKRAKTIHQWVDGLMVLLPFEKKYFTPHYIPTEYVGHPVTESGADKGDKESFMKKNHLSSSDFVMTVLPGSRKTEVKYLLPIFKQVVQQMKSDYPALHVVVPTVQTVLKTVEAAVQTWDVPVTVVCGEKERYDAFSASTVALAASGTVSLELAMAKVPHLIVYHINPLTAALAKRILKIRFVNLINLLADKEIIPELLQESCNSKQIVCILKELLGQRGVEQTEQTKSVLKQLGQGDNQSPSKKAEQYIKTKIKKK